MFRLWHDIRIYTPTWMQALMHSQGTSTCTWLTSLCSEVAGTLNQIFLYSSWSHFWYNTSTHSQLTYFCSEVVGTLNHIFLFTIWHNTSIYTLGHKHLHLAQTLVPLCPWWKCLCPACTLQQWWGY